MQLLAQTGQRVLVKTDYLLRLRKELVDLGLQLLVEIVQLQAPLVLAGVMWRA